MGQVKYLSDKEGYQDLTNIEKAALTFIKHNGGATRKEIRQYLSSIPDNELQNLLLTLGEKNFLQYQVL